MEQPVTGSYRAKAGWGGENCNDDHSDSLCWVAFSLQSTLVPEMLTIVFVASHLLWLHAIFPWNLPICPPSDCELPLCLLSGPLVTSSGLQPQLIGLGWALHPRRAIRFSLVQNWDSNHLWLRLCFYFIWSSQQVPLAERGNGWPERLNDLSRVSQLRNRGVVGKSDLGVGPRHCTPESICSAMELFWVGH